MIKGLPKQTESPGPLTRASGCKGHTGAAMVADFLAIPFNRTEIWRWIIEAIDNGIILDEEPGTNQACIFVSKPALWMQFVAGKMGKQIKATEVYRGPFSIQAIMAHPAASYIECQWYLANCTHAKKGSNEGRCSHFNLCELDGDKLTATYDPYPGLALGDNKSIRLWELEAL